MLSPSKMNAVHIHPSPPPPAPAAAGAATPARTAGAARPRRLPRTPAFVAAVAAVAGLAMLLDLLDGARLTALAVGATVVLLVFTAALAAFRTLRALIGLGRREGRSLHSVMALAGNAVVAAFGSLTALSLTAGFVRGRQLRRFGRVLAPPLADSSEWTTATIVLGSDDPPPLDLAEQWRQNGRSEHASVAAFARLTLDLMALGAPPRLVAEANRDALDEIRHAELCFSLAQAIDGRAVSPGPFPAAQHVSTLPRARRLALCRLAVSSLIDGALHEGVSARIIAALARRCAVPAIRTLLKEIAADEGRHAAHGWTVVRWCLQEGGWPVAQALLGALRTIPRQMRSALPAAAAGGAWERWGIHGHGLEAAEYAAALDRLAERVRAEVQPLVRAAA
jgi:hypothetical protein